jgi:hypothetical protein
LRPSSAAPSGADGAHLDGDRSAVALDLDDGADADLIAACVRDDLRPVEPRAQVADAGLEEALLVLRGVVLEVLRQVAEFTRLRDRLHDLLAAWAFELRQLLAQRRRLPLGQPFVPHHFERPPRRRDV